MDYKLDHQVSEGESYTRCNQIIIDNRRGKAPTVTFGQESIVTAGGQALHIPMTAVRTDFDPTVEIPIVDPQTGEPTGATVTHEEFFALIYSAYLAAVNAPIETEGEE